MTSSERITNPTAEEQQRVPDGTPLDGFVVMDPQPVAVFASSPRRPAETCTRCQRKLRYSKYAHRVDGQRVCRTCDPPRWPPHRRNPRSRPRAVSFAPKAALTRAVMAAEALSDEDRALFAENPRPRTRGDCSRCWTCEMYQTGEIEPDASGLLPCGHRVSAAANHCRPCPWAACSKHLALDLNPQTGSIRLAFSDIETWELKETCSLDVAEHDGMTLEEVGALTNVTRERIRQIESRGIRELAHRLRRERGQ